MSYSVWFCDLEKAIKKIFDLGLVITVFDTDGSEHEVFDKQSIEVFM